MKMAKYFLTIWATTKLGFQFSKKCYIFLLFLDVSDNSKSFQNILSEGKIEKYLNFRATTKFGLQFIQRCHIFELFSDISNNSKTFQNIFLKVKIEKYLKNFQATTKFGFKFFVNVICSYCFWCFRQS